MLMTSQSGTRGTTLAGLASCKLVVTAFLIEYCTTYVLRRREARLAYLISTLTICNNCVRQKKNGLKMLIIYVNNRICIILIIDLFAHDIRLWLVLGVTRVCFRVQCHLAT